MFADIPALGEATDSKKAPRKTGKVMMLKKRNPKKSKEVLDASDDSSDSSSEISESEEYEEISDDGDNKGKDE